MLIEVMRGKIRSLEFKKLQIIILFFVVLLCFILVEDRFEGAKPVNAQAEMYTFSLNGRLFY